VEQPVLVLAIAAMILWGLPAAAGSCSEEINRLESRLRDAKTNPADQPTGEQSIGAQLSHQPTPESMAQADIAADERVQAVLSRAKAFDAEHKQHECLATVEEAKLYFSPE
jgi:hypothetical protein